MSIELKPGWLERQAKELTRPYTDEELAALNDDVGPFPSVHRMGATVADLRDRLAWIKGSSDAEKKRAEGLFNDNCTLRAQLAEAQEQVRTLTKERDGWRLVVRDACSTMGLQESDVDVSGASLFAMSISEGIAARKQRDEQNATLSRLREALEELAGRICGSNCHERWMIIDPKDRRTKDNPQPMKRCAACIAKAALSLLDPVASSDPLG